LVGRTVFTRLVPSQLAAREEVAVLSLRRVQVRTDRRRLARWRFVAAALLLAVTGCVGTPVSAPSTTPPATSADLAGELRSLAGQVVDEGITGAIVRVADGHAVVQFAAGLADVGRRRDLQVGDEFRIGSITKTFVAALVLQLVAERRLGLETRWSGGCPARCPTARRSRCGCC
jgi:D-alanyl-D-alanine carboxypeptidase